MKFSDRVAALFRRSRKSIRAAGHFFSRPWARWLIGAVTVLLLVLMFPRMQSLEYADMKEGSVSTRKVIAPFNFDIEKTREEYENDIAVAIEKIHPVYQRDADMADNVIAGIDSFFNDLVAARLNVYDDPGSERNMLDSLFQKYPVTELDLRNRYLLIRPRGRLSKTDLEGLHAELITITRDVMALGVLDGRKDAYPSPDGRIVIFEDDEEVFVTLEKVLTLEDMQTKAVEMLTQTYTERERVQLGYALLNYFFQPNVTFDQATYEKRITDARASVPLSSGFVFEEERIVDENERITPEIRKKLVSLARAMAEKGPALGGVQQLFPLLGKIFFIIITLSLLIFFIREYQPEILNDVRTILLFSLTLLLVCGFAFLILRLGESAYLVPAALGTMLIATLFDARLGFAMAAVTAVMVGGIWGNEFNIMAVSFITGIVGAIAIRRVRDRRQLIQAIFILAGAYIGVSTIMGSLRYMPFRDIMQEWTLGGLNGLFTPIVAYGLLPLIESVFYISTDFYHLEMSNKNNPLMKPH
jgi:membrane-associated HD superfamily phosphohydrolase